ncbi:MAG: pilus assembly protein [Actinomycetota bacterium]|nr:pilus assembly protein [Actinomycetota bacterium]
MRAPLWRSDESGQATVELVGLAPLAIAVTLLIFCVLAAGRADELAGHAAEAGAVALLQDEDAETAAREALPDQAREDVDVEVKGGRVTVRVRPDLPVAVFAEWLVATESAHAGSR